MTTSFALAFDWAIVAKDIESDLRSARDLIEAGRGFDGYRALVHIEQNPPVRDADRPVVHPEAKARVESLLVVAGAARLLAGASQEQQALSVLTRVLNGEQLVVQRRAGAAAPAPVNGARPSGKDGPRRLARSIVARMRAEIAEAHGREVLFIASDQDHDGVFRFVRVAARGQTDRVNVATDGAHRGDLVVHNHPSGDITPSDADLQTAHRLHRNGVGFAITDAAVRDLYIVTEPFTSRPRTP